MTERERQKGKALLRLAHCANLATLSDFLPNCPLERRREKWTSSSSQNECCRFKGFALLVAHDAVAPAAAEQLDVFYTNQDECVHIIQCLFIESLVKELIKVSCKCHVGKPQRGGDDKKDQCGEILVNKWMPFSINCCSQFRLKTKAWF